MRAEYARFDFLNSIAGQAIRFDLADQSRHRQTGIADKGLALSLQAIPMPHY
jgi:hypothetical protein